MELLNGLPVLRITVDKIHQGTDKISLVDFPAMQIDWQKFASINPGETVYEHKYDFETLGDQQKLAGPFIIPEKPILREHPETKQRFYVIFPTDVVQEIADRFNENLNGGKFNKQHTDDVEGVYVAENWIIENPDLDKAKYKFKHDLPAGTWYGVVKVKDAELWKNEIVTGVLNGFSVEMIAGLKLSIDNAILEETALAKLEELGEVKGENWTLISSEDIAENEDQLTDEEIISEAQAKYEFNIIAKPGETSSLDQKSKAGTGTWLVRYEYSGPKDGRNRNFCRKVLNYQDRTGKVFRKEDINAMSFRSENKDFGTYSIFRYKGSYGCRHRWRRLVFFEDLEDDVTRRVGNVPQVTSKINDKEATTDNTKPKKENFNKLNMKNENLKFVTIEEMEKDARVIDAVVTDPDGTVTVDGVTYTVVEGVITEVMDEAPADETPADETPANETPGDDVDADVWKAEIMDAIAQLTAKVEQLEAKVNGEDPGTSEQFTAVVRELFTELKNDLKPGTNDKATADDVEVKLSTQDLVAKKLAEINERKKKA